GLTDSVFRNPHGLDDPGAHSTPFDMAVLGRELLKDPELAKIVATEKRDEPWHDNGLIWNGNYLLVVYPDAIGIKTGYTDEAGWSIVSAARRDGRTLVASVFNSTDIYWDSMRLFDWAFTNVPDLCKS
ncbi:MAG TPA: D-alanyl-D-alanine carboxypeptidase, partial [Dehalococcoidia bacterium]|nr:D-alanyl-D-alanine carboxypeptidase [Dehalococcoidia bacterium]